MIETLQKRINERKKEVLVFFEEKKKEVSMPIYASFDIRDSGFKASIIDTNLFPGGFNNLTDKAKSKAGIAFKNFLSKESGHENVLIIPEEHTRNEYYLSNLCAIKSMLEGSGINVTLGTLRDDIEDALEVKDSEGHKLLLEKVINYEGYLKTNSFDNGVILLNNDFSVPGPSMMNYVKNPMYPNMNLGWIHRKKYNHFKHFCKVIKEFSEVVDMDPWLFCPITEEVNDIDFATGKNIDKVSVVVDDVILRLKKKYQEHGIKDEPFVFVKDNSGTYGLGIFTVRSGKEVLELNSKARRKMKHGKQRAMIDSVIIQEGIPTKHRANGNPAEPVLYMVSGVVVGGFMRIHDSKDDKSSLNSPGAKFDLLLHDNITCPLTDCLDCTDDISIYEILAKLACIAIGREMGELK